MKKINGLLMFCLALSSISIFMMGCQEESLKQLTPMEINPVESRNLIPVQEGVLIQNGRFTFEDQDDFDDFMDSIKNIDKAAFLASLPPYAFESFYNTTGIELSEEIGDEELEMILNQYAAVEIGGYVMKLNFETEEGYVIPSDATPIEVQQTETAEDILSLPGAAMIVPFQENVFDIINGTSTGGGDDGPLFNKCDEECLDTDVPAVQDEDEWDNQDCITVPTQYCSASVKINYKRFLFWERIIITRYSGCASGDGIDLDPSQLEYVANWEVRCKDDKDDFREDTTSRRRVKVHGGSRCLVKFNCNANFSILDPCTGSRHTLSATVEAG